MRVILFSFVLILVSCSKQSAVSSKLSGCDSVVITFQVPDSDSIINRVAATDKKAIRQLAGYLNGKEVKQDNCGFDGKIDFFEKGETVLTTVFRYSPDSCRRFLYDLDGKVMKAKISNEALDFLQSLAGGKNSY